ncbi:MAG TPA: fibronectin type III domain-containing protein [Streptosporangiaceae bacterium]
MMRALLALTLGASAVLGTPAASHTATGPVIYVSPHGSDTLARAQQLVRSADQNMNGDITVELESGTYRLTQPLSFTADDSGTNGHDVVWTAAPGARPVVSGAEQITGWHLSDPAKGIWSAPAPAAIKTRQLYVNGVRADVASGPLPVKLTPTPTGYTASAPTMETWRNPGQIEFVYTGGEGYWSLHTGGLGSWTEPRCPVAAISGTTITMAQPCWDNSTKRVLRTDGSGRTVNLVGPAALGNGEIPAYAANAYELLTQPGQWYLDSSARTIYYIPRPGQDMRHADVEAPVLQTLVSGQDVHNVVFRGIQFSYATWLAPSTPEGFSEIQANYTITGPNGYATQGLCQFIAGGTCPYGNWTQEPGNVNFQSDTNVRWLNDTFTHLGAAGLRLGDGSRNDTVQGSVFTDISGNGVELGGVDDPMPATPAERTSGNQILDSHFYALPVEYHGGVAIHVGYAEHTLIAHNQIDNTAYTAISLGWGGWPDKIKQPATPNYSNGNVISDNLIENPMQELADGGAIYTQGITGTSLADGEQITGNVILGALDHGHAIYTDNGATFITVNGNVEFGNENDWGSRHTDYTPGATGDDPLAIENNYWQQGDQDSSAHNVTVSGNHIITALSQAPAGIVGNAGLQWPYRSLAGEDTGRLASVPEAPDQVAAFAAAGQGYVAWNPSFVANGAPVRAYIVTAEPGGASVTVPAAAPYAIVPGLADGATYTFTVRAINRAGASASSLPSAPVTVASSTGALPSAPASVKIEPGDGTVSVHITAPASAGGTPVIGYTISGPGIPATTFTGHHVLWGATGTNTIFVTIGGLTSGQTHTFSVAAVNAAGTGPAATASG